MIYANSNSTNYALTTSVYLLFVNFHQFTVDSTSYMAIYALVSYTRVENMNYYSNGIINYWSLFYIWSGTIEIYNTNIRQFFIYNIFDCFYSSKNIPPLVYAVGTNITMKNCYFNHIRIPKISCLIQLNDKSAYHDTGLPYVANRNHALFENLTFNFVSTFEAPVSDPSLLLVPLFVAGSHSQHFPLDYLFLNVTMTNNIITSIFFYQIHFLFFFYLSVYTEFLKFFRIKPYQCDFNLFQFCFCSNYFIK